MFLGNEGDPSAPIMPSAPPGNTENSQELRRDNNNPGPYAPGVTPPGGESDAQHSEDGENGSRHVFYAVELLIFAFVGFGWLSVREYLGQTPVMDVVTVISVIVCALLNLALALLIPLSVDFAPCAHAYFSHCVAQWVLYVYSLSESTRLDTGSLCCTGASGTRESGYSAGPTHAAAFFGGLPMHQVPGVVSVAYLTVFLLVAGAQARACTVDPRGWVVRGLGLSITSLVAVHLGAYLSGIPLCSKDQAAGVLCFIVGIVAAYLIVDFDWIMQMVYTFSFRRERSVQQRRDHRIIRSSIHTAGVGFISLFSLVLAVVIEKSLSVPLLIVFLVCLVAACLGLGYDAVTIYGSTILGVSAWVPEPEQGSRLGTGLRPAGFRWGQGMHVPSLMTRARSVESMGANTRAPFLRRYPIFLQGQANQRKKSY
jgi:hypothetical protein